MMIRVAIIGLGFIGRNHLEVWNTIEQVKVTAICTRNMEVGTTLSHQYGCTHYVDLEKLLLNEDIDVVDICTPTFLHESNILLAAQYHKHIICEKPVTMTLDSFDRILDAIHKYDVKLMAGHVLRFWTEYSLIKEMYDDGLFGRIHNVHAHRLAEYPPNTEWRKNPEESGGGLFDLHLHDIDYCIYLFGKVRSVYSAGTISQTGCWDHLSTIATFENNIIATIECGMGMTDGYPFSTNFRISGEDQTLEYDLCAGVNIENLKNATSTVVLYTKGNPPEPLKVSSPTDFTAELTYFLDCVRADKEPLKIMPKDARYTIEVLLAVKESLKTKTVIHLS